MLSGECVLLGRELSGWSALGGRSEREETPVDTAVREFHEETAEIFSHIDVRRMICDEDCVRVVSKTPSGGQFVLFVVAAAERYDLSDFRRARLNGSAKNKEKIELKWVSLSSISSYKLRNAFAKELDRIRSVCGFAA